MVALVQLYLLLLSVKIIGHGDPGVVRCYARDTIEFMSRSNEPEIGRAHV